MMLPIPELCAFFVPAISQTRFFFVTEHTVQQAALVFAFISLLMLLSADLCDAVSCQNYGTCVHTASTASTWMCDCVAGFSGTLCVTGRQKLCAGWFEQVQHQFLLLSAMPMYSTIMYPMLLHTSASMA